MLITNVKLKKQNEHSSFEFTNKSKVHNKKKGGLSNSLAQVLNCSKYETDTVKEKYFIILLQGEKNQINKLMNLDLKNTFKSIFKW